MDTGGNIGWVNIKDEANVAEVENFSDDKL